MPGSERPDALRGGRLRLVGRRGAFLLVIALGWTMVGFQVWTQRNIPDTMLHHQIPDLLRVGLWWGPAALAIFFAFRQVDWPAYPLLIIAPIVRGVSYLWGTFTWLITDGAEGAGRAWASAPIYFVSVFVILLIAGWPERIDEEGEIRHLEEDVLRRRGEPIEPEEV